jgi:hypothetical protein
MGKKCIPGLFCVENMTLFVLVLILILLIYFYYKYFVGYVYNLAFNDAHKLLKQTQPQISIPAPSFVVSSAGISAGTDPINDVYSPPMRMDSLIYPPTTARLTADIRTVPGVPVNVPTNAAYTEYKQIGILTKNGHGGMPLILPLMGRNLRNGRDKWQYYTMTNTAGASINTKLPVSVNGKSCTGEYGCDNISNGDIVYVEGFNDTFRATIYESGLLAYIPFL